jgi:polygalacturonase
MKSVRLFFAGFFLLITANLIAQSSIQSEVDAHLKNLPFATFAIKVPTFPDKTFTIVDAGAKGDGITKNTQAINSTIEKCSKAGGGKVVIPPGLWLTGPITMQSNVNLYLAEGAIVIFSSDLADYVLEDRGSRVDLPNLINGSDLENVAITGKGVFNGNGQDWRPVKKEKMNEKQWKALLRKGGELSKDGNIWSPRVGAFSGDSLYAAKANATLTADEKAKIKISLRPYMLGIRKSKNVLIDGITLTNSPKFAMYLNGINGLVLRNVSAINDWWAQNADGLDISVCKNVLMYNCTVSTGDDGICMKSSHSKDGSFNKENIVIKDCKVYHGHGAFVIGSNTDGNMRNIYVKNCSFIGTKTGLRFKSGAGRGGKVTNIFCEDIFMKDIIDEAIVFEVEYEDRAVAKAGTVDAKKDAKIPDFDGISIKNVFVDGAKVALNIRANDDAEVKNVSIENGVFKTTEGVKTVCSDGLTLNNVNIITEKSPTYRLTRSANFTLKNVDQIPGIDKTTFSISSVKTKNMLIESAKIPPANIKSASEVPAGEVKIVGKK